MAQGKGQVLTLPVHCWLRERVNLGQEKVHSYLSTFSHRVGEDLKTFSLGACSLEKLALRKFTVRINYFLLMRPLF